MRKPLYTFLHAFPSEISIFLVFFTIFASNAEGLFLTTRIFGEHGDFLDQTGKLKHNWYFFLRFSSLIEEKQLLEGHCCCKLATFAEQSLEFGMELANARNNYS